MSKQSFSHFKKPVQFIGMSLFSLLALGQSPSHALILSPTSATATSEYSATYAIGRTIDQSGLSVGFASGIDEFDTYISGNPIHTLVAAGNEWFTPSGVTSATVQYDLGKIYSVDKFALWNEDGSGIGAFNLLASTDGISFSSVLTGVSPIDNPYSADYPAQVFALGGNVNARYFQLDVSGCPQPNPNAFQGCGIGEIAFNVNDVPGPLSLLGVAAAFGYSYKLRRRIESSCGTEASPRVM